MPAKAAEPSGESTAEGGAAATGGTIKVGMVSPMTGPLAGFGETDTAEVQDAPMASMYGLAKRSFQVA